MSVIRLPIKPPVQDSAVTNLSWRSRKMFPTKISGKVSTVTSNYKSMKLYPADMNRETLSYWQVNQ